MADFTSKQSSEIGKFYSDFSVFLHKYRFQNWDDLSEERRDDLQSLEIRLSNYASRFYAISISLSVDELKEPLEKIKDATKEGKKAIKKINNVKKAIKLAKSAVSMGVAILSKNPGKIIKSAGALYKEAKA
jgi:hypothetical protein